MICTGKHFEQRSMQTSTYFLSPGQIVPGAGVFHSLSGILPAHFRPNNPKTFLKAYLAPLYTNFEAHQNNSFFGQNFLKITKNGFFCSFFLKNLPPVQNYRVFIVIWECLENQFGRSTEKGRQKCSINFWQFAYSFHMNWSYQQTLSYLRARLTIWSG